MTDRRQKAIENARFRLLELQSDNGGTPCEQSPELFYPEDYEKPDMQRMARKIAKEICKECPLMQKCREFAILSNAQYGVFGGIDFFQNNKSA
jgi:WhiB family redox-sensing transcriptional regulator